jgi:holliday junction DNA helicase RuvA
VIAFLDGALVEKGAGRVVLEVNGIGYEVLVPVSTIAKLPSIGTRARLSTRMVVREDGMTLYGFAHADDRALFDLLVAVSGVGPKVALSFLSALSAGELRRAVAAGDVAALTVVPGVGKKVAQRVVLDLKDRLGLESELTGGPLADVREALVALGITPQEATEAIAGISANGSASVEDLLREALQGLGRG